MTPFFLTCARRAAILAAIILTAAPLRAQHQPRETDRSSGPAEPRTGTAPDTPAAGTAVPRTHPPPERKRPDVVVVPDGAGDYGYGGYDGGYYYVRVKYDF